MYTAEEVDLDEASFMEWATCEIKLYWQKNGCSNFYVTMDNVRDAVVYMKCTGYVAENDVTVNVLGDVLQYKCPPVLMPFLALVQPVNETSCTDVLLLKL